MSSSATDAGGTPASESQYADYYNGFYRELARLDALGNTFSKIDGFIPTPFPGMKVLDIGAGFGSVSGALIEKGCEVHALEANTEAIEALERKGFRAHFHDITKPIELHTQFDLVLLLDVLEHVFDPVELLVQARRHLRPRGRIMISVPLYFDIIDRLRLLFTGRVISYDNKCYGDALYARFRSYNYDHIRFFRPEDIGEMAAHADLRVETCVYGAMPIYWRWPRIIIRLLTDPRNVARWPNVLAHSARAILAPRDMPASATHE